MDAHWIGVAFGLFIAYQGVSTLVEKIKISLRGQRVPGVIVGRADGAAMRPGTVSRSGVFRFNTLQGQQIVAKSAAYSFPGPKVGKPVTVVYDPARPEKTAERAGVQLFTLLGGAPLLIVVGLGVAFLNYRDI